MHIMYTIGQSIICLANYYLILKLDFLFIVNEIS